MTRSVRQKCEKETRESDLSDEPEMENLECLKLDDDGIVDWTRLPDDAVIDVFTRLSYRDRANMSSACKSWRSVGSSSCLWRSLDLRAHRCEGELMECLASRCSNLQKLRFRGSANTDSLVSIRANNLKELSGDFCKVLSDSTLTLIVTYYKLLESIQLGPDNCEMITSDGLYSIAIYCPNLKKLRLSGISDVSYQAIRALADRCPNLHDIGFIDCLNISTASLANVVQLRFLSVAGTTDIDWDSAGENWTNLPYLEGLDVSRTDVDPENFTRLVESIDSLKVVCTFNCPVLEEDPAVYKSHGKMMLGFSNDTFKVLSSMFPDTKSEQAVFSDWRSGSNKNDANLDILMMWVEWILSHALLCIAEANLTGLDQFWLDQGADLLLTLLQSSQADVQEWAATGLATFAVVNDISIKVDAGRVKAVRKGGGVQLLLRLARSLNEGLQLEATKAISNLSTNPAFARSVAGEGGITVLASLAKSTNRFVAEEAAGGLWNLSAGDKHMGAIFDAGAIKSLVDLIIKWPRGGHRVLERAAGALANLAADEKYSMEVAAVGGISAVVTLACTCKHRGVQEQATRALANLTGHGDSNTNIVMAGQEDRVIDVLILLIRSQHDAVRQEAATALWHLSGDARNRERIALAGGVVALVALAQSCVYASPRLQEGAAGALWALSVSEANSIAIGREGGITALIALAQSPSENVHEIAAGALSSLVFNPENALRLVEDGGISVLISRLSSISKLARFMAAIALAYIYDGRKDELAPVGSSTNGRSNRIILCTAMTQIQKSLLSFAHPLMSCSTALSATPAVVAQVTEFARIPEVGQLRCSQAEIGRFVSMLRHQYRQLKLCAAFALLQFTAPGGQHALHHVNLLQASGAARVLRVTAAAKSAPLETRVFAKCVLRNMEYLQTDTST
ncbi:putative F-box domain, armadillo-like helical, leucine-rich repeat domain superfamily [Helianthus annuus]|uniref:F-box domain, armadillo-like helical, leucine-rich repeat domain superfamily n=1 Tax=Helianthus annuus TaxID=4232 RepID=A0A9K3JK69_HELAN|nr:protein ARABIDILLO 1 [Helianthus annuus]KAF5816719.1 putative F-box domain, armadillo-like helical, leucine-rich repeat domain superfamily [Helianthus annuus]KAJ0594942.1 putative F-box domain, armadillo-like helical, leucine-rich repeat domain superfamily [Helianthus annuus]KAJ0609986.1 putative F-box domain, armadillo-like helical, leucine-rich repeat domain superfamily [Helianthus annuus]KAJ0775773.1 putative F-box domain, armadillo-like helical, leucine-rich repeat domain superfamily [He